MLNKFRDRLRELRQEKGLRQKALADILNISPKTISHYENGYSEPTLDILIALSRVFDVTTDYFLGIES